MHLTVAIMFCKWCQVRPKIYLCTLVLDLTVATTTPSMMGKDHYQCECADLSFFLFRHNCGWRKWRFLYLRHICNANSNLCFNYYCLRLAEGALLHYSSCISTDVINHLYLGSDELHYQTEDRFEKVTIFMTPSWELEGGKRRPTTRWLTQTRPKGIDYSLHYQICLYQTPFSSKVVLILSSYCIQNVTTVTWLIFD